MAISGAHQSKDGDVDQEGFQQAWEGLDQDLAIEEGLPYLLPAGSERDQDDQSRDGQRGAERCNGDASASLARFKHLAAALAPPCRSVA